MWDYLYNTPAKLGLGSQFKREGAKCKEKVKLLGKPHSYGLAELKDLIPPPGSTLPSACSG